jgi:hypothetical protein
VSTIVFPLTDSRFDYDDDDDDDDDDDVMVNEQKRTGEMKST